jgi:hypothetical protein
MKRRDFIKGLLGTTALAVRPTKATDKQVVKLARRRVAAITHGDFQTWCTENHHRTLEKIINAKSGRQTPYYILVIFKKGYNGPSCKAQNTVDKSFEGKIVIHTRMVITDQPPLVRLVGTSLWRIDNRIGEAKCLYVLPPDKPVVGTSFEDEKAKDSVLVQKSMQGMPLVYNR